MITKMATDLEIKFYFAYTSPFTTWRGRRRAISSALIA